MAVIVKGYRKGQPFDLEVVEIDGLGHVLEVSAARAFISMRAAAAKDGIRLWVNTAFRSMHHQTRLWLAYRGAVENWEASGRLGKKPPLVAQPGFSTHQLGLSVDINRAAGDDPGTKEADSPADQWLRVRAHEYGFVNDVVSEPWHWTYLPEQAKGSGVMV